MVTAPARRVVVRDMVTSGLSERRALAVVRMSAAALRYEPQPIPIPVYAIVALAPCPSFYKGTVRCSPLNAHRSAHFTLSRSRRRCRVDVARR